MKNIERFNLYTAHIFGMLYASFPVARMVHAQEVVNAIQELIGTRTRGVGAAKQVLREYDDVAGRDRIHQVSRGGTGQENCSYAEGIRGVERYLECTRGEEGEDGRKECGCTAIRGCYGSRERNGKGDVEAGRVRDGRSGYRARCEGVYKYVSSVLDEVTEGGLASINGPSCWPDPHPPTFLRWSSRWSRIHAVASAPTTRSIRKFPLHRLHMRVSAGCSLRAAREISSSVSWLHRPIQSATRCRPTMPSSSVLATAAV